MHDAGSVLRQALASLRGGRAAEAETLLRNLLRLEPAEAGARQLLGIVLLELGRPGPALAELDAVLPLLSASPALHYNRGNALAALGRLDEAALAYAQACALKPDLAEAQFNAGNVLRALGRREAALAAYERASAAAPALAAAHFAAGSMLLELARDEAAIAAFDRAIALDPAQWLAHNRRGVALHRRGRLDEAMADYDAALALDPNAAEAWNNRGNALHDLRQLQPALECFERALRLQPDFPEATSNLGMALQDLRRLDEAQAAYERAIALRPRHPEAFRRRATLRLLRGEFAPGWADYEMAHELEMAEAPVGLPWWRGESLAGKSILLSEPNGIGDTLQFIRFAHLLFERGARVAFAGPARFRRLLAGFDPRIEWVDERTNSGFDFRCLLWSLPHWLGVGGAVEAERMPYLQAEAARVAAWSPRLDRDFVNVGVCWQGNPLRKVDRGRSIPLAQFLPLARIPGVRLVSLQKNFGVEQLELLPEGMQVQSPGAGFDEGEDAFVDSAAMLHELDLLVSSDTSIVHLAGALGRPAWVALQPVPEWRWLLDRDDSPWYPSVRAFRQAPGDGWAPVFEAMAQALEQSLPALRAARAR